MDNQKSKSKSVTIIAVALIIYTIITILTEEGPLIKENYAPYLAHKISVILIGLLTILMSRSHRFVDWSNHAVFLLTIYYICVGEQFYPGYNLAYIQLILAVPLILKFKIKFSLFYIVFGLMSYLTSFTIGPGSNVESIQYPVYVQDVYFSILTSTGISFFVALFVSQEQEKLNIMRSKLFSFGLRSSMLIHDLKKNIEYSDSEKKNEIDQTVEKLRSFLGSYTETPDTSLKQALEAAIEKFKNYDQSASFKIDEISGDLKILVPSLILESIIFNILVNSFKACRSNNVAPAFKVTIKNNVLSVQDNGPGFSEEILKNKDFSDTRKSLGLFNIYNAIISYGGDMRIANNDNGAVVYVNLPT